MISEVKIKLLKAFPKILSASLGFFSPNLIEASGAPPRPKRLLKAVTVSYTHLDVYKRQMYTGKKRTYGKIFALFMPYGLSNLWYGRS